MVGTAKDEAIIPAPEVVERAFIKTRAEYDRLHKQSIEDPDGFWGPIAEELHWFKKWDKVLDWQPPFAQWFAGGLTNMSYNCLDRHLSTWRRNKAAIVWEGEPGDSRTYTYQQLHREVCRLTNVLRKLGVKKGDRVGLYMPMIPELPMAMLACARIGAPHVAVFGGFSAEALRDRMNDTEVEVMLTADGGWRRAKIVPLKGIADEAAKEIPTLRKMIVVKRTGNDVPMQEGRDLWWHEVMAGEDVANTADAEPVDAEQPLFILHTSGTTGKPKGVVHTTGGFMVGNYYSMKTVIDIKDDDAFWCTADIGWVMGHSKVVYGALLSGATTVIYEGSPDCPREDRVWEIVEKNHVTIMYTAPTLIRMFLKWGEEWIKKHDITSLRLMACAGEPMNPEAWRWFHREVGRGVCPLIDTFWQTETGTIMLTGFPGATPLKPGSVTLPFFGIDADIVDGNGNSVPPNVDGLMVVKAPWPSMFRTVWKDKARYESYWQTFGDKLYYVTGDGAHWDDDGYLWMTGRVDDVVNIAGHRLGTAEVESALVLHPAVAEAAVVGRDHEIKGQVIIAFVTLANGNKPSDEMAKELQGHVSVHIGAWARPESIRFTDSLPKTRSGKIMRRLLRDIAAGRQVAGDVTTLEDLSVVARLQKDQEE